MGSSWQRRELATEGHVFQFTNDKSHEMEADYTESDVLQRSAAMRGPSWKRSQTYRSRGRRSGITSEEEANEDFVQEAYEKRFTALSYVRGANKRSALAELINRINGKRSADSQDSAQSDTSARVSSRDAQFYPGRIFKEKPFSYLRKIGGGVHSKRDPEPIKINRNVHSREEHNNNEHAHRSIWSDGIIEVM